MPAQKTNKSFETDMTRKVIELKSKIRNADAILIATPEYKVVVVVTSVAATCKSSSVTTCTLFLFSFLN